jgi:DNA-binding transcriptional LysR family regulator
METTVLRLFRQVAEGATVTGTAAGAHMTQAALSKPQSTDDHGGVSVP